MVKSELILRIAEQNPYLYERDVEKIVNTILDRISDALVVVDRVKLRGLGTFALKSRDARTARNPKTGAAVSLAEKRSISFKTGKAMHTRLNAPEAGITTVPEHDTQWQSRWLGRGPTLR